jgi:hypothetical protein
VGQLTVGNAHRRTNSGALEILGRHIVTLAPVVCFGRFENSDPTTTIFDRGILGERLRNRDVPRATIDIAVSRLTKTRSAQFEKGSVLERFGASA